MEEMMMEKGQLITFLQKYLKLANIAALARQVIQQQQYRTKSVSLRCVQREIILNLIIYAIYREKEGVGEVEREDMALLQCQIKRWFAVLPARRTKGREFNNSSNNFLTQLLLLSQIVHKIIQNHRIASSDHINAQTIFITVVYLSTDKLVSPYCFALLHRRLQKQQLPNYKSRKTEESHSRHSSSNKCISAAQFQEEVRNVLNPSRYRQGQTEMKRTQSVYILFNNFQNKANNEHSRLFKNLKENTEPNLQPTNKIRKSISQQNFKRVSKQSTNTKKASFKWSKCQLLNAEYIPFYISEAAARQVRQKAATNYINYRVSKQRLTINTEKPRVLLKI